MVVRQDGGSFDLGYTRAVLRPDGKIVAAYYFNGNVAEERTIKASIIDPAVVFPSTPPPSSTTVPVTTTTPPTTAAPTTTVPSGTTYLSDLQPAFQTNAVGPMERDRHNGGAAAGDGGPIVLAGRTYAKGLGTNAFAETRYNLGGRYTTFTTDVGIDDSCGNGGSATAEVHTENGAVKVVPVFRGSSPTQTLTVNVTGRSTLRLVSGAAGDGNACDRVDWAGARLTGATPPTSTTPTTAPPSTTKPPTSSTTTTTTRPPASTSPPPTTAPPSGTTFLSSLTPLSATNGLGPVERDRHNGGQAAGDGGPLVVGGTTYSAGSACTRAARSPTTSASSTRGSGRSSASTTPAGPPARSGSRCTGSSVPSSSRVASSGTLTGASSPVNIDVDVRNGDKLILYVIDAGSNGACARSDWADARLLR